MRKLNIKLEDKVAAIAGLVILITNPGSGSIILEGLEDGFRLVFQHGSPVNLVATGIVLLYIAYKIWMARDTTKIPTKNAKTQRAGKMIEA